MFDVHIHIGARQPRPVLLLGRLRKAGMHAGIVLSLPPDSFRASGEGLRPHERLNNVMEWHRPGRLYPFFWLDPTERTAERQVRTAAEAGVYGFKVICDRFYPSEPKAMRIFRLIAEAGRPILFHSGILWDGKVSSKFNRPVEFECLLDVPKLRFALAHAAWPWCDELIALYGKILKAREQNPATSVEMFIDTTPGTPIIYRKEVLTKCCTVGYDVKHNILFGSDATAEAYDTRWTREWVRLDRTILAGLRVGRAGMDAYFSDNAWRFLGPMARAERGGPAAPSRRRTAATP